MWNLPLSPILDILVPMGGPFQEVRWGQRFLNLQCQGQIGKVLVLTQVFIVITVIISIPRQFGAVSSEHFFKD